MKDTPKLSHAHHAHLAASAILDEVVERRGYMTITTYQQLTERGFSSVQSRHAPGLGIPLWTVEGEQQGWQFRPDTPRVDRQGKMIKYETPYKGRLSLDIHPMVQPLIGLPEVPLWITEGVKKGDALGSFGCCALALMGGVWGFIGRNDSGGKTILPDWRFVALNGRQVYIAYDNDVMRKPEVHKALVALKAFLVSKSAVVSMILLPESPDKVGVDDFLAQGHTVADLLSLARSTLPSVEEPLTITKPGFPTIEQDRERLPQVVDTAEQALMAMPGAPCVFQRARLLVEVAPAEPTVHAITRDSGTPIITVLGLPRLREYLALAANWYTPAKRGKKLDPDMPAHWVMETLLARGEWTFPPLTGIVNTPTLRPDGTVLERQGYDAPTGLYVHLNGTVFPPIPETPTAQQCAGALAALNEPFQDFQFSLPAHHSGVLAAILTLVARYTVDFVPLFPITASTSRSGKTLLANCIGMIAMGREVPKIPQAVDLEEERKRLLAIALDGDTLVCIDNVAAPLGNSALDAVITSRTFKDRLLGKNQQKEAPIATVFFATGNNLVYRGDLAQRILPIEIITDMEHPEERDNFTDGRNADKLLQWIAQHRARLVTAALTLLRGYFAADMPCQDQLLPWGGFDRWTQVIRGCLVWMGEADPNGAREGVAAKSDEGYDAHRELLEAWDACYLHETKTLAHMIGDIQLRSTNHPTPPSTDSERYDRLKQALGAFDDGFLRYERLNPKTISYALKRLTGRVIDGKRLIRTDTKSNTGVQWKVETLVRKVHTVPF